MGFMTFTFICIFVVAVACLVYAVFSRTPKPDEPAVPEPVGPTDAEILSGMDPLIVQLLDRIEENGLVRMIDTTERPISVYYKMNNAPENQKVAVYTYKKGHICVAGTIEVDGVGIDPFIRDYNQNIYITRRLQRIIEDTDIKIAVAEVEKSMCKVRESLSLMGITTERK